jgi:hypothetical protein
MPQAHTGNLACNTRAVNVHVFLHSSVPRPNIMTSNCHTDGLQQYY